MSKTVLQKKIAYEGCPIYVRNTEEAWEYLTIINNEIYAANVVVRKSVSQRLLNKPYTAEEVNKITQYMLAMAQTTIDNVLGVKHVESPYDKNDIKPKT